MLVGNNPIEMSGICEKLHQGFRGHVHTNISFTMKGIPQKVKLIRPSLIIVDELFGYSEIQKLVEALSNDPKTKHITMCMLKSSGLSYSHQLNISHFITKDSVSSKELVQRFWGSMEERKIA